MAANRGGNHCWIKNCGIRSRWDEGWFTRWRVWHDVELCCSIRLWTAKLYAGSSCSVHHSTSPVFIPQNPVVFWPGHFGSTSPGRMWWSTNRLAYVDWVPREGKKRAPQAWWGALHGPVGGLTWNNPCFITSWFIFLLKRRNGSKIIPVVHPTPLVLKLGLFATLVQ